ncbi:MAG: hypothetical protein SGILL_000122 [Bacillariaceae sp.]
MTVQTTAQTNTLGYDLQVSMAISCIIAWLIPHLYFEFVEFTEYRIALEKRLVGNRKNSSNNNNNKASTRNREATKATIVGATIAIIIISAIYCVSAGVVSYATQGMDRRADAIVIGMGRIMSAVLFIFFAIEIPLWLGVIDAVPQNIHFYQRQVTCSVSKLRRRVCRSVLRHFFVMYFILLLYFCNVYVVTIVRSTIVGLVCGIFVVFSIWLGRMTTWKRFKRRIALSGSALVSIGSALAFTFGVLYIAEIWFEGSDIFVGAYGIAAFFGWCWVCLTVNFCYYRLMKRRKNLEDEMGVTDHGDVVVFDTSTNPLEVTSDDEAVEDNATSENVEIALKSNARSRSSVTQTTTNIATESDHSRSNNDDSDGNDTDESIADFTLEDLEEIPSPGACCWLSKKNAAIDGLVPPTPPPRTCVEKMVMFCKWFLWSLTSTFHLYLLAVNIGATYQQTVVRQALPDTFELLYPPNYVTGPMCAWDEGSPNADIQTFDSIDEVYAANYTVIHCGACGACSNWNDLSLQWTTRTFLAAEAQKWYVDGSKGIQSGV